MFLTRINAREIISHVKPEFAQFQKKVTYKPLYPAEFPKVPEHLESNFDYSMKYLIATESPVNEQIMSVQEAIENYAKHKGVNIDMARKVDILEGQKIDLKDSIAIDVYNPKTKKIVRGSIPVLDQNQTVTAVDKHPVSLELPYQQTPVVRVVGAEYEDNFLRHLYRTIENLVKRSSEK